ncbi:thermonuclease family protein [Fulvivirgaceae bacterium BMA10]|uniref:Thermonuclease family protein n=1 Tax=Splendidivirga corallicola TaxID=3051826 RepID=A0ABT8KLP8_9BACT|nr:thermonuclease family protein [Fulvivirgaceae bacterium BMA10]
MKKSILVLFFVFVSLNIFSQKTYKAKVVKVVNGSTIQLLDSEQDTINVILKSIECPVIQQAFGEEARNMTVSLCLDKVVDVEDFGKDRYGNAIVSITLPDQTNLSYELVKNGLAWYYKRNREDTQLECLATTSKENEIGLWGDSESVAPWIYKRQQSMLVAKTR